MRLTILSLVIALAVTGCASIVKGTSQDVVINTPGAEGAQCTLTSKRIGTQTVTTPATLNLKRSKHDIAISCSKPCYMTTTASMHSGVEGWTIGNILLGGIIGLGIDAWTGALNKYVTPSNIPMQKDGSCEASFPQAMDTLSGNPAAQPMMLDSTAPEMTIAPPVTQ